MTFFTYITTPIGKLRLRASDQGLLAVDHTNQQQTSNETWTHQPDHPVLAQAIQELEEYFAAQRQSFSVNLTPQGTEFQQSVWSELQTIPYGETWSYAQIAIAIGNPKAVRAVGAANGRNPLSIFIPCHRVIGTNGKLTGYAGGLEAKQILLNHEFTTRRHH